MDRDRVAERADGEGAREIVDAAVSFRLAEDRDDSVRIDRAGLDRRLERRHIVWRASREAVNDRRRHGHGSASMSMVDVATAPNTPPCILIILIAARWLP